MNLQFYVEKLKHSEEFKKFLAESPEAYPCSGFFIIDKEKGDNKEHFDFYLPSNGKMFTFNLEEGVKMQEVQVYDKRIPEKISLDRDFDFHEIENLIIADMEKNNIKNKVQKFIFSLQKLEEKDYLVGTVFITNLGMIKVNVDLANKKITQFEKKSFFDVLKQVK